MFINALLLAIKEIRRNLLRSFLTVLGIVIGVASVIAMVILGDGTTAHITQNISKLGSNMLTLTPGAERRGPASAGITTKPFNIDDIAVLQRETTYISAVAPSTAASLTAVYGNENHTTAVYGTNNDYFTIRDWTIDKGRTFTEQELSSGKAVCVIGHTVQEELFGQQNPINKNIRLEKFSCQVIGTLESKGAAGMRGMDQDDFIAVPIRMFQRRISGSRDISAILLSFKKDANIEEAKKEVTLITREIRRIRKGMDDDFHVHDMRDIIKTMTSTTKMLTYLLGSVAAISLLVGGIGIMNIMLVSVTERTREIGIRLAIGAMEREVLLQFLVESIVLSSLGGLIGIIIGLAIALGATNYFDIPFIINTTVIIVAFIFSMFVGIFFGYFPAKKAAKMNPIDALRHE
ncbi:ABC transporter permease [Sulfurimonas marina]|uniref:FtsX-like permease family protein n=1 Tax=Sulfurimonas marina TaxID=2590551 RepID=A0A7M1AXW8_9BACT|nr:ABC transporter permease [Sulfurimonas marina]QOP42166.1 FtsX-like permease family protein [Sulfurimonas marina]